MKPLVSSDPSTRKNWRALAVVKSCGHDRRSGEDGDCHHRHRCRGPPDVVARDGGHEHGQGDPEPSETAQGDVAGDQLGQQRQRPQVEDVDRARPDVGGKLVEVPDDHVAERVRDVRQREHEQRLAERQAAQPGHVVEDDVDLGQLGQADENGADEVGGERCAVGGLGPHPGAEDDAIRLGAPCPPGRPDGAAVASGGKVASHPAAPACAGPAGSGPDQGRGRPVPTPPGSAAAARRHRGKPAR